MAKDGKTMPRVAALPVSGKGCAVNGNGAGGGFCNDSNIHHFIMGDPFFLFYTVMFNHRKHGITATEAKEPDLEKCIE